MWFRRSREDEQQRLRSELATYKHAFETTRDDRDRLKRILEGKGWPTDEAASPASVPSPGARIPSGGPKFVVHHIGARGVTQAFPTLPAFEADLLNVLYEADPTCVDEIRRLNAERAAEVLVIAACIAGEEAGRDFHHSHCGYGSSLLEADPAVGQLYVSAHWLPYDYTVFEAIGTARVEPVHAITLDRAIAGSKEPIPFPDFLSLDTQGSELEILRGAPKSVEASLGIVSEVEFLPLYRGQPLLGEISGFLQEAGFVLCGFSQILTGSLYRGPLGLRGNGIPVTTDALFLKRPDRVTAPDALALHVRLFKLAFTALVHGHFEHALWALATDGTRTELPHDQPRPSWYAFTDEFRALAASFPPLMPDSFAERAAADADQATARFLRRLEADAPRLQDALDRTGDLLTRFGLAGLVELQRRRLKECLRQVGAREPLSSLAASP